MTPDLNLDVLEAVRLVLSAVEQLAADSERRSGSVESQKAAGLAHRARSVLDAVASAAIAKAG
jgi:hypothetical protein